MRDRDMLRDKHNIRDNGDSWIVDEKYEITKDGWCFGTIYYYSDYTGRRYKDFPQWLFDLKYELINSHIGILDILDYLLSHNKNYTMKQYNKLLELRDIFIKDYMK